MIGRVWRRGKVGGGGARVGIIVIAIVGVIDERGGVDGEPVLE